jgi:hypothetical protein
MILKSGFLIKGLKPENLEVADFGSNIERINRVEEHPK